MWASKKVYACYGGKIFKNKHKQYFKRGMDGASTLDPPFHLFIFIYLLILYLCEEETDGIERNLGLSNNQRELKIILYSYKAESHNI